MDSTLTLMCSGSYLLKNSFVCSGSSLPIYHYLPFLSFSPASLLLAEHHTFYSQTKLVCPTDPVGCFLTWWSLHCRPFLEHSSGAANDAALSGSFPSWCPSEAMQYSTVKGVVSARSQGHGGWAGCLGGLEFHIVKLPFILVLLELSKTCIDTGNRCASSLKNCLKYCNEQSQSPVEWLALKVVQCDWKHRLRSQSV